MSKPDISYFKPVDAEESSTGFLMYTSGINSLLEGVNLSDIKLLLLLCDYVRFNDYAFELTPRLKKDFINKLGIDSPRLSRSIKALRTKRLILLDDTSKTLVINPWMFFKGYSSVRKKIIGSSTGLM